MKAEQRVVCIINSPSFGIAFRWPESSSSTKNSVAFLTPIPKSILEIIFITPRLIWRRFIEYLKGDWPLRFFFKERMGDYTRQAMLQFGVKKVSLQRSVSRAMQNFLACWRGSNRPFYFLG